MRLIDADELIERMRRNRLHSADVSFIKSQDPVDAVRVRHGRWQTKTRTMALHEGMTISGQYPTCTLCNYAEIGFDKGTAYCPNCGAKMEEVE